MPRLEGLDDGEIPIEPTEQAYTIEVEGADEKQRKIKKVIHRRQLPITAAYAFTDYRSQGQTLPYVTIDIAKPPTGKLSLFNLYVALSRSSGRHTIRLLHDFDEHIFHSPHDEYFLQEDDRLEGLNVETRRAWDVIRNVHAEM